MNNTQVAKVVYEATRALGQTQGESGSKSWEELSDQQRSEETSNTVAHVSGNRHGINIDDVVKSVPQDQKLKTYISAGIVDGFSRFEKGEAGGNSLDQTASEEAQLRETTSVDTVNARNTVNRANAPEPQQADAQNVKEALERADKHAADANAQPAEDHKQEQ